MTPAAWLKLWAQPYRWHLRLASALALAGGLAQLGFLLLLAHLIYEVVVHQGWPNTPLAVLAPVGLVLIRALAQYGQDILAHRASQGIRQDVRSQLMAKLDRLGPAAQSQLSAGQLASQLIEQVEATHGYYSQYWLQKQMVVLLPLAYWLVILRQDGLAALFLALAMPLIPLFMALVGMGAERLNRQQLGVMSRLSGHFLDQVRGLQTLRWFNALPQSQLQVQAAAEHYRERTVATLRLAFLSSAVLEFFSSVAIAVVAIYIGFGLLGYIDFGPASQLTLLSGLIILMLAPEFFQPLRQYAQGYHDRAKALAAASDLGDILSMPGRDGPLTVASCSAHDHLEVQGLSLGYLGSPILDAMSWSLPLGQTLWLSGPSGSGKSSLLSALAGYLQPLQGQIKRPLSGWPMAWLGQDPWLVQGSLADNLALLQAEVSREQMQKALVQAGLWSWVQQLPAGLDTQIGEQGYGLSGGQAQRLALARQFLQPAALLLLDEPLAQLDLGSQAWVLHSLAALKAKGCTLIIASHDPQVAALADWQLALDAQHLGLQPVAKPPLPEPQAEPAWQLQQTISTEPDSNAIDSMATDRQDSALIAQPSLRALSSGFGPWLGPYLRRSRLGWRMLLGMLLMLITALAGLALLALSGWFIASAGVVGMAMAAGMLIRFDVYVPGGGIRFFALTRTVARYLERLYNHSTVLRALAQLRGQLFRRLGRLKLSAQHGQSASQWLSRLTRDTDAMDSLFLRLLAPPLVALLGLMLLALGLGWWLPTAGGLVGGVGLLLWLVLVPSLAVLGLRASQALPELLARMRSTLLSQLQGQAERELAQQQGLPPSWLAQSQAYDAYERQLNHWQAWGQALLPLVLSLLALGVLMLAAEAVAAARLSPAVAALMPFAILALAEVFMPLAAAFVRLGASAGAAQRLNALGSEDGSEDGSGPGPETRPQQVRPDSLWPLSLDRVSLIYPGALYFSLQGVNLRLQPGQKWLITGRSGSGKSSLLQLLMAEVAPSQGRVTAAGVAMTDLDPVWLYQQIGALSQRSQIFHSSLADNLRLGKPDASDAELWQALTWVELDGWAEQLSAGLATILAEQASTLSGGQARRLALARVLLAPKPLMILDEPFRGLDDAQAQRLAQCLQTRLQGSAVMLLLHQPPSWLTGFDRAQLEAGQWQA